MSIEEELKELILKRYKTVKNFADVMNLPYTTIDSILRRGVGKANVLNIIDICKELDISADALADGKIKEAEPRGYSVDEIVLIKAYRELNEEGKAMARSHINFLRTQPLYKKCNINDLVEENA